MIKSSTDFVNQRVNQVVSGLSGTPNYMTADGTPVQLSGLQAQATLDPSFQATNPAAAALYRYREFAPENNPAYRAGRAVRKYVHRPGGASHNGVFGTNGPISGALAAGLPSLLLGLGAGWLADKVTGNSGYWTPRLAAGAGALGAGAGAYLGYYRNKAAGFGWKSESTYDPSEQISNIISRSPDLSFQQKNLFIQGVAGLSDAEAAQLLRLIMASGGFGIGALLTRYIMGAGATGTILGGIAGGLIGNAIANTSNKDALGRNTLGNRDIFGNPFLR